MNDTKDDRHLHLERVGEDERIVGAVPTRVKTERIAGVGQGSLERASAVVRGERPRRVPDVHGLREDIVIDEAGVDGKDAHE